jgi:two-component system, LytTR family, sensor kinase
MSDNPLFRDLKSFSLYLIIWLFISGLYFSLIHFGLQVPLRIAITDSLIFNLILAGLGSGFWYPAKFISFDKDRIAPFIFTHLAGSIISVVLWLSAGFLISGMLIDDPDLYNSFFYSTLAWRILTGMLFYFLLITFYYTIIYYTEFQLRVMKEAELKNLITEAELKSLRFQINPHFVFNSLNSISSLTLTDPEGARSMIIKLADFLRSTVSDSSRKMNTLDDELSNIKLYLDIEKIRFGDKFEYIENADKLCREVSLPSMILQPLIENAIKHSVYEALEKVIIKLECSRDEEFLNITVSNTVQSDSVKRGTGVGLRNISERLQLIYGRSDLFRVFKEDEEFRVKLYIPLSMAEQLNIFNKPIK